MIIVISVIIALFISAIVFIKARGSTRIPTRIKYESDIHIEFNRGYKPDLANIDIYILAGDIGEGIRSYNYCLKLLEEYPNVVIIHVAGNHEFYRGNIEKTDFRLADLSKQTPRYHYLQNDSIIINNIEFIGSTLWTNINNRNDHDIHMVWGGMNDFKQIRYTDSYVKFSPYRMAVLHDIATKYIFNKLEESEHNTVVITHHKPFVTDRIDDLWSAFQVDLEEQFSKCSKPPKYWIYGHTHESWETQRGGTAFLSNSLGYPGETTGFIKELILEI